MKGLNCNTKTRESSSDFVPLFLIPVDDDTLDAYLTIVLEIQVERFGKDMLAQ